MEESLLIFFTAYLLGSFSPAHLAGKLKGIDLAGEGSGNLGARNVKRMIGKGPALAVLAADLLKGGLAAYLAITLSAHPFAGGAGWLGVISGHGWPFYLRFRGGKGLAASAGALLVLSPPLLAALLAAGGAAFALSRNLYAASVAMTASLPPLAFMLSRETLFWPSCPVAMVVLWFHRGNIRQMLKGQDNDANGK